MKKNSKKQKNSWVNFILILMLVIGLSLLLYPPVSNYWNSFTQSKAIANYSDAISKMDNEEYRIELEKTQAYNQTLLGRLNPYLLSEEQRAEYNARLDVTGTGVMGYIEIPSVNITIPVYHGTDETTLQVAVGHLDWTSMPTGGESTHCVLSGHRGLPSARLFTDLDKLVVGDVFMLHVLDQTFTYEIDQILVVEPHDTRALLIEEGKDLVTLVTCTPYGVNSHRMLVRGHRIENLEAAKVVRVTADAIIVDKLLVAPFVLAPILLAMLVWLLIPKRKHSDN